MSATMAGIGHARLEDRAYSDTSRDVAVAFSAIALSVRAPVG